MVDAQRWLEQVGAAYLACRVICSPAVVVVEAESQQACNALLAAAREFITSAEALGRVKMVDLRPPAVLTVDKK